MKGLVITSTQRCSKLIDLKRNAILEDDLKLRIRTIDISLSTEHKSRFEVPPRQPSEICQSLEMLEEQAKFQRNLILEEKVEDKRMRKRSPTVLRNSVFDPAPTKARQAKYNLVFKLHREFPDLPLSKIAQKAKVCYTETKSWITRQELFGENQNLENPRTAIRSDIESIVLQEATRKENPFFTIQEVQRRLREAKLKVSGQRISKILRFHRFSYGKHLPKRKSLLSEVLSKDHRDKFASVLNSITQARINESFLIFSDEFKTPLNQVADKYWRNSTRREPIARQRSQKTWTVCVAGTLEGFRFIKIHERELTNSDYEAFIGEVMMTLEKEGRRNIVLIHDGPKWHGLPTLKNILGTSRFITTVPQMFQSNILEYAFSVVRQKYRRRELAEDEVNEARGIANCFRDSNDHYSFLGHQVRMFSITRQLMVDLFRIG